VLVGLAALRALPTHSRNLLNQADSNVIADL
jgi:hypothetical protein